jgi:adenylate cyclase
LGDGVNIAARLEGLAEVGGICVSRAVHEQVANKLSVQFADIGEQEVKNIPTPVHAYLVAMRREDGTYAAPQAKKKVPPPAAHAAPGWMWPLVVAVVCLAAIGVDGFLYLTKLEMPGASKETAVAKTATSTASQATSSPSVSAPAPARTGSSQSLPPAGEKLVPSAVPFVGERIRLSLANDYLPGADYKAFALNLTGINGLAVGQQSEEAAKNAALDQCQKRADTVQSPRRCELYAVGNNLVYLHGPPPLPPLPWIKHDASTERPFSIKEMPLVREPGKERLEKLFVPGRKSKSIALGPGGQYIFNTNSDATEESTRRALESCGALAGVACTIVASDDVFVVPVPTTMKVIGFFRAANSASITADARDDVARKLEDAASGWNAVAVGTSGRPGLGLKATSEQSAVNDALGNCVKRDSDCHVIAIGPFAVGPN